MGKKSVLLVHPPVAKPSEPPAGLARLAGALRDNGIPFKLLDGNMEGLLHLLRQHPSADDTWTRRAAKNRDADLANLRRPETYRFRDRYVRSVSDLNRLLQMVSRETGSVVGLADYEDPILSPQRSTDLLAQAASPERSVFHPWFGARLPELLDGTEMIGFSLNYLSQALSAFAMIGYVKTIAPSMPIILGGGLVTSWMRRPGWRSPFAGLVDHLVAGQGEEELLRLCGVDDAPAGGALPAYEDLPLRDYLSPGLILPYSAASGCYWNRCSFCPERAEGNDYRPVPVRKALTEIHSLTMSLKPVLLHLLDSAVTPALMDAFADDPPGVPWYGFARFGGQLEDPDYCARLRNAGCVMLKLGLESGDQGVLDALQKGVDLGKASRVLRNLRKAGIAVYLYLLFGTPAETETEARHTLEFVSAHGECIDFLNLALFNMPIHSHEAATVTTSPFYEGDLSLYTAFHHPRGWNRDKVRRFLNREFSRHPSVAPILRNDPPVFTSNHAALFAGSAVSPRACSG